MNNLIRLTLVLGSVFAAQFAFAQESGHLNVTTIVQIEEVFSDDQGVEKTRLVDAAKVVPGDEVIYTVTFVNISDEPAENVVITNPLPQEMNYVEGSAFDRRGDLHAPIKPDTDHTWQPRATRE